MEADQSRSELLTRVQQWYAEYAGAVDRGDLEALAGLVTEDVTIARPGATEQGKEAFLDVYRGHVAQGIPLCQHAVTNVEATVGERGIEARAYFRAFFFEDQGTRLVVGQYDDLLVESHGRLRAAHKGNVVQRILRLPAAEVVQ
ncbi:nuclear transport factor 2 family protein [Nocardioides houyundeii]|uniref:nuclear transport factor 2 family protein n=1 Tax=Nocardioides houyundeii TaxID=2045452 RepID=UPI000C77F2F2|nr:nuclear transport factor 2 family protein [Nocardioides houyundeii]